MSWDEGLEGPSRRVAANTSTPLRVIAGPGTGKTFAMMRRVARLLEEGVDPGCIFVATFTRNSARDLQQALRDLGVPGATEVHAGTLHSFCFAVLMHEDVLAHTGRVPRVLLKFETRFLVADLKDQFGGVKSTRERLQAFNAAWARLQTEEPGWAADPQDQAFQDQLDAWLRFHHGMLIGEVVPLTLRYLRDNPASPFRNAFEHVVVDEYQDLNRSEQRLLDLLAENGTLTIVGDEDQSIYSFKYAHPEGIRTFHEDHPGTHDENLAECRRCPQHVVRLANALISHNKLRTPRQLTTMAGNPSGDIHIVQWGKMAQEAQGLAAFIHRRVAGGVEPGRVLVLAPRRQFGYAIRDALNAVGTPAHSFFAEEALDTAEAQQAFTLLTLLVDPDDRVALRCWCGFSTATMRIGPWARLRAYCEESGESPREALDRLVAGELTMAYSEDLVDDYRALIKVRERLTDLTGQELVAALFPKKKPWAELLRSTASALKDDFEASRLREHLVVAISQPELPLDVDYVRVMSLHKSKGLTADLVVVAGCIEGLIPTLDPDLPTAAARRQLEEQRRLFYVALTRTRQTLVLSSVTALPRKLMFKMGAEARGGQREWANTVTSRFLSELGPTRPTPTRGQELPR